MSTHTNLYKNSKTSRSLRPTISVVIPTLNAQLTLKACLYSLKQQTVKSIELLIVDGGSVDNTLSIAKKYKAKILKNPLKTGEAAKSIGIKQASGKYILLLDSDNILPTNNWLEEMLQPLQNEPNIVCSEPSYFMYRKDSGFIERYSALLGANDPYAWYIGNIDKINHLSEIPPFSRYIISETNTYFVLKLANKKLPLPTIGANGTIYRSDILKEYVSDYFFDIDFISIYLEKHECFQCTKTKNSIIHTYCESSIIKFIKKQTRRVVDFYTYKSERKYNWKNNDSLPFVFYSLLVLPGLATSIKGFINKHDVAWFFHPVACFLTTCIYVINTIKHNLGLLHSQSREQWSQ